MTSRGKKIRDLALKCGNQEVEVESNIIDNDLLAEALQHDALLESELFMLEAPPFATNEEYGSSSPVFCSEY